MLAADQLVDFYHNPGIYQFLLASSIASYSSSTSSTTWYARGDAPTASIAAHLIPLTAPLEKVVRLVHKFAYENVWKCFLKAVEMLQQGGSAG